MAGRVRAHPGGNDMHYTRISADCHLDLPWMPPDLFAANASPALRDRMPHVAEGPDGPYWTSKNGASFGLVNGVGPAGQKYVPGQHHRVDVMAATGLYEDGKKGIRRVSDPLWQAVNDVALPLHFHTFPALPPGKLDQQTGLTRRAAFFTVVSGFQMNLVNILAAVIGAAVLERYPKIRIAFGESGIGWVPYALDRMDFEWEDRFHDLGLTMKPSDYWRRQCKATFQFDRIGTKLIDDMGAETLMWGSDYPHGDGVWPESSKYIEEQFGHLPPEITRKIVCENAGKFYGLIT